MDEISIGVKRLFVTTARFAYNFWMYINNYSMCQTLGWRCLHDFESQRESSYRGATEFNVYETSFLTTVVVESKNNKALATHCVLRCIR